MISPSTSYTSLDQQKMKSRDWRSALRTPPPYRIGSRPLRFNFHFTVILVAIVILVILFVNNVGSKSSSDVARIPSISLWSSYKFNSTYPLTLPISLEGTFTYRIGVIADLDKESRIGKSDTWKSYLKKGFLSFNAEKAYVSVSWDTTDPITLEGSFSLKGRGMELSELITFNGKILTFDDRTGIVYELLGEKVIPWVILMDGEGHSTKGFKSEWAAVKDHTLYVGSMGKEWTSGTGEYENDNPMFVKAVSTSGEVKTLNWSDHFKKMRESSAGIKWPGYMIHESGMWSEHHKKWFFLPRRCSKEKYNETMDEHMGCDLMITANDGFTRITTTKVENKDKAHGFSSFKFIPGSNDNVILAIKSEEVNGKTGTFITSFTIDGKVLMKEERIPTEYKFEGIEFL